MGFLDKFKEIMDIPEEEEFNDEFGDYIQEREIPRRKRTVSYESEKAPRSEAQPRVVNGGRGKTVSFNSSQMQVVLVKPDHFEDVSSIADHLNEKKTVVLNLESAGKDVSRRIVDFLSGATYANHGNIRKVANNTFILVPADVDVMGELLLEDFEDGKIYF